MDEDRLEVAATGRAAQLGDPYDNNVQGFIKQSKLLRDIFKLASTTNVSSCEHSVEYLEYNGNFEDLFIKLSVDEKLQQNVIGSYDVGERLSLGKIRGALLYTRYVNHVQVDFSNTNCFSLNVLKQTKATHIVTQICSGWQTIILLEYNQRYKYVKFKLLNHLQRIQEMLLDDKDVFIELDPNLAITIVDDKSSKHNISTETFNQVIKTLKDPKKIPDIKPLKFIMISISEFNNMVSTINSENAIAKDQSSSHMYARNYAASQLFDDCKETDILENNNCPQCKSPLGAMMPPSSCNQKTVNQKYFQLQSDAKRQIPTLQSSKKACKQSLGSKTRFEEQLYVPMEIKTKSVKDTFNPTTTGKIENSIDVAGQQMDCKERDNHDLLSNPLSPDGTNEGVYEIILSDDIQSGSDSDNIYENLDCADDDDTYAGVQNFYDAFRDPKVESALNEELNILLLGETGVGKSTWIDGFANYLTYPTLEEAECGETQCPIPILFTLTDENFRQKVVAVGADKNENARKGESCTQFPKTYSFIYNGTTVRLIDTPGIGDTRGVEKDRDNFFNILTHIATFDKLHGICILLKPNNARLNVMFQYCIKELLTNLHKDASRNIVFCFTNARGTFYLPGDTMPALMTLLEDNGSDIIPCKDTVFCVDNESVRFLAAMKSGVTFTNHQQKDFSESWQRSVDEINRMMHRIISIKPHLVKNTLSINSVRYLIIELSKPLADITAHIQKNLQTIEIKRQEMLDSNLGRKELAKYIHTGAFTIMPVPLRYPKKVCFSSKCRVECRDGDKIKIHSLCFRETKPRTIKFINKNNSKCKQCGCAKSEHTVISYEFVGTPIKTFNKDVQKHVKSQAATIETVREYLLQLELEIEELKNEQKQIITTSVKFVCFLKQNAIAPYNDALGKYLEHLMIVETNETTLQRLKRIFDQYIEEVEYYDKKSQAQGSTMKHLTPDDIKQLIDQLYAMKHSGKLIEEAITVVDAAETNAANAREIVVRSRHRAKDLQYSIYAHMSNTNADTSDHPKCLKFEYKSRSGHPLPSPPAN